MTLDELADEAYRTALARGQWPERLAELRRTQYSPVEALRQHIDGAGGLRERMDEGDVTAFEADVVMGYDALQDVIAAQADEIERQRREREVLAAAVRGWGDYQHAVLKYGLASVEVVRVLEEAQRRHNAALALLEGQKGGGGA